MVEQAVVRVALYNVHCPECDEMIVAPDTAMGRTGWTKTELEPGTVVYCMNIEKCGTAKRRVALVVPMATGMIVELALA